MSNGYLIAAGPDLAAAHEISDGFGLDVLDPSTISDTEAAGGALASAANLGVLISTAAAQDASFVAVLQSAAKHVERAQLILADADARAAFPFLPDAWPAMSLDEARSRAAELVRRRETSPDAGPAQAAPLPPTAPEPQAQPDPQDETPAAADSPALEPDAAAIGSGDASEEPSTAPEAPMSFPSLEQTGDPHAPPAWMAEGTTRDAEGKLSLPGGNTETEQAPALPQSQPAPSTAAPSQEHPWGPHGPQAPAPMARTEDDANAPKQKKDRTRFIARNRRGYPPADLAANARAPSAPADATAFAPKKLRRETPELVRIVIHQPKDLKDVIKTARKIDPRAEPAPQSVAIGDVALGASIGVSLDVRGAFCDDGELQRRTWAGEPLDFSFAVEGDADAKQAVIMARVFVNDAQIGIIAFTRPISGPKKKPADAGKGERMRKIKRVFLSYSSKDREIVSAIATAYESAGVPHFWDRTALKSGEEWSPRLRKEIERADLFHLCWSKSAAASEWVEKETEHALTRRKRSNGKQPDITVQMLDGPPWAPHPAQLDAINFDDFVRAAIVGYARGAG